MMTFDLRRADDDVLVINAATNNRTLKNNKTNS